MNRVKSLKITLAFCLLSGLTACGKDMPPPIVVEPEAPRAAETTEGSLWPGETEKSSLFSDKKASAIGDIIVVQLVERTSATNKAATKTKRKQLSDLNNGTGGLTGAFKMEYGGNTAFDGAGATSRSEVFTATISATVSEILPNGQLKIDGQRRLKINDAWQYIQVSGLVRPEDISYDNTIISSKIANAQIIYDGTGRLDEQQRSNWLGRAVEDVWPF